MGLKEYRIKKEYAGKPTLSVYVQNVGRVMLDPRYLTDKIVAQAVESGSKYFEKVNPKIDLNGSNKEESGRQNGSSKKSSGIDSGDSGKGEQISGNSESRESGKS